MIKNIQEKGGRPDNVYRFIDRIQASDPDELMVYGSLAELKAGLGDNSQRWFSSLILIVGGLISRPHSLKVTYAQMVWLRIQLYRVKLFHHFSRSLA